MLIRARAHIWHLCAEKLLIALKHFSQQAALALRGLALVVPAVRCWTVNAPSPILDGFWTPCACCCAVTWDDGMKAWGLQAEAGGACACVCARVCWCVFIWRDQVCSSLTCTLCTWRTQPLKALLRPLRQKAERKDRRGYDACNMQKPTSSCPAKKVRFGSDGRYTLFFKVWGHY